MTRLAQPPPREPAGGTARSLSEGEVREFREQGFVVRRAMFAPWEVKRMRAAFERLEREARSLDGTRMHLGSLFVLDRRMGGGISIQRIVWCGAAEAVLDDYGRDPRLVGPAAQLLGSRTVIQLINQAHFKLPRDGVEFPWHQDSRHRRFGSRQWKDVNGRGSYVQAVTALDDVTPDNGPLRFVAGSQRLGHVDGGPDGRGGLPPGAVDPARVVAPLLRAGDVVMFGPYTIHGSLPNRSDRPRRAFINGYCCPGANSRHYPGAGAGRPVTAPWAPDPLPAP